MDQLPDPKKPLTREQETEWAARLHEARQEFVGLVDGMPEPWRTQVLGDDASKRWLFERIETCHRRLTRLGREAGGAELRAVVTQASRCRDRIFQARDVLVLANTGIVVNGARRYRHYGIPLADLVQEGMIGLISAIDRFEHDRGLRITTYAVWWIRKAIGDALADRSSLVRLPRGARERVGMLRKTLAEMYSALGRRPEIEEVAEATGLPEQEVAGLINMAADPESLDRFANSSPAAAVRDATSPLEDAMRQDAIRNVPRILELLSPRESKIIKLRFGIGCAKAHTLRQIGRLYNLSRERVRQIEAGAINRLHEARDQLASGY